MGSRLERIPRGKLFEERTRLRVEFVGQHYLDRNVVIASRAALEGRDSLIAQAKALPILCARR
jgi:hypothetical protein